MKLPKAMKEYVFVHGNPVHVKSVADDVSSDGTWVRLRYSCMDVHELLKRISSTSPNGAPDKPTDDGPESIKDTKPEIIVDCSLFVQIYAICMNEQTSLSEKPQSEKPGSGKSQSEKFGQGKRIYQMGTGRYAMEYLSKACVPVRVLTLPKNIYDVVKAVNPDSAQYLIDMGEKDGTRKYLGLAKNPMIATLEIWKEYLNISFMNNAIQEEDEYLRKFQLDTEYQGHLHWSLISI